jgi:hypothetical protein
MRAEKPHSPMPRSSVSMVDSTVILRSETTAGSSPPLAIGARRAEHTTNTHASLFIVIDPLWQ